MSENNQVLTKATILQGTKDCKKIEIDSLGGGLWIRKLGDGEISEIEAVQSEGGEYISDRKAEEQSAENGKPQKGRRGRGQVKLDLGKAIKNMRAAKHLAVAFSLSNEKNGDEWSPDEVAQLPRDAVDEIARKVIEHSDLEDDRTFRGWRDIEELAEEFHEESKKESADA